jgi:cytidylate kinase
VSDRGPVIAIDGPAGSGKSTLARRLAETLGLPYLNTGLMYRAIARAALRAGIDPEDGPALARLADSITFDLDPSATPPSLRIDGSGDEQGLRSRDVESTVSAVARHPEVRGVLRAEQRRLSRAGAVVEGRDIGSVVAPEAPVKIYLGAAEAERVARRADERGHRHEDVAPALATRDALDAVTNPLEPAADAREIDSTRLDAEAVFARALEVVRERLGQGT